MERFFTILIASLCIAPLFFLASAWSVWGSSKGGNSDQTIASGYAGLFIGIGAAILGFLLAAFLAHFLITKGYLRPLQVADLVMAIGWGIAWFMYADTQPWELTYADHNAILDIEVRASKALLMDKPIDKVVGIRFVQAGLTYYQPERIREEGEFFILPWYTYLHRVAAWDVRVDLPKQETFFLMDLPKRPAQSTTWSDWIAPTPHPDCTTPDGLMIRYRFRLVPYGQDP